jgi:hypothetical protein
VARGAADAQLALGGRRLGRGIGGGRVALATEGSGLENVGSDEVRVLPRAVVQRALPLGGDLFVAADTARIGGHADAVHGLEPSPRRRPGQRQVERCSGRRRRERRGLGRGLAGRRHDLARQAPSAVPGGARAEHDTGNESDTEQGGDPGRSAHAAETRRAAGAERDHPSTAAAWRRPTGVRVEVEPSKIERIAIAGALDAGARPA